VAELFLDVHVENERELLEHDVVEGDLEELLGVGGLQGAEEHDRALEGPALEQLDGPLLQQLLQLAQEVQLQGAVLEAADAQLLQLEELVLLLHQDCMIITPIANASSGLSGALAFSVNFLSLALPSSSTRSVPARTTAFFLLGNSAILRRSS
jgi:hypothetical protein